MEKIISAAYSDPEIAGKIVSQIKKACHRPIRLMEVCGTHTMAIFKNGIRFLLPEYIDLISGPGCPVCVTSQGEIDAFLAFSRMENVIVATFGDLVRVPGSRSSLEEQKSQGRDIRIVYSSFDALKIAEEHPEKEIVFLGVGFETTAPTVAASILEARERGIDNYSVMCANKRVPPVLMALVEKGEIGIDGFLLPGHVSTVIGKNAYLPFFNQYKIPGSITGFEPVDILMSIKVLVDQILSGRPDLVNCYTRAVSSEGNEKAQQILDRVFDIDDAKWRGMGQIPESGFCINSEYEKYDAVKRFGLEVPESEEPKGCACGEILTGRITPEACPLYKTQCTPMTPVGPCMVSTEGTCAAYYRYHS